MYSVYRRMCKHDLSINTHDPDELVAILKQA